MGRHFEVRAKAMAQTAAKKSAVYMRASKEIYMAAKAGVPDPNNNLALRSAIDKWKSQSVPKDVIDRAIKKAQGGDIENYIEMAVCHSKFSSKVMASIKSDFNIFSYSFLPFFFLLGLTVVPFYLHY
mgnify:CR=1 FL=1